MIMCIQVIALVAAQSYVEVNDMKHYAAIKYNESNAAFYVEDEDHEDYLGEAWETDVVIIGNIHDNPEILKGGEDNG